MKTKIKRLGLLSGLLILSFFSRTQERFEFGVNAEAGYYFPKVLFDVGSATPENAFSPGLGIYLNYLILPQIEIGMGGSFNYLHTNALYYAGVNPEFNWHSIDVPLKVNYKPLNHLILSGGIIAMTQVSDVYREYKNPEWSWLTEAGWEFDNFRLLFCFSHSFGSRYKYLRLPDRNAYTRSKLQYREINIRLDVPLWRFLKDAD